MPQSPSEVKAKKKSAFSCETCRRRKLKCAGQRPRCSRCIARNDECIYHLAPTLSYTAKLEARVRELEEALEVARGSPGSADLVHHPPSSSGVSYEKHDSFTNQLTTSFFGPSANRDAVSSPAQPYVGEDDERKARLVYNALEQRSLEDLAGTPEPFQYILRNHWCWIQPLFNFIYRPTFTRDMQTMGPYYSHVLMNAILAHSVRWCSRDPKIKSLLAPYDNGQLFSRHARTLFFEELQRGPGRIPLIQTALLLSAQECAAGNRTQAWIYSGLAFRLLEDIGINVNIDKEAAGLTDEDLEVRVRLFWSCYFWDKLISLYLGRSPTIKRTILSPPQILLDDSAEHEIWVPHGISLPPGVEYPPTKSHATSCFMETCKLSVILHEILHYMYDPQHNYSRTERENCIYKQESEFNLWWEKLPSHLKIDAASPPTFAPASHIVTMNCLYHTFRILLFRPALFDTQGSPGASPSSTRHLKECIISATSITILFDLFRQTFGEAKVILSLAYSLYTAASIFLIQLQAHAVDDQTWQRLLFCSQALEQTKGSAPVLSTPLDLLANEIVHLREKIKTSSGGAIEIGETVSKALETDTEKEPPTLDTIDEALWRELVDLGMPEVEVDPNIFDVLSSLEPISANFLMFDTGL